VHRLTQVNYNGTITQYLFDRNLVDEGIDWLKVALISHQRDLNPLLKFVDITTRKALPLIFALKVDVTFGS
jgi:hypothetical protein